MTGRAAYLIVILMALVLGVPNALVGHAERETPGGAGMDAAPTAAEVLAALPAYTGGYGYDPVTATMTDHNGFEYSYLPDGVIKLVLPWGYTTYFSYGLTASYLGVAQKVTALSYTWTWAAETTARYNDTGVFLGYDYSFTATNSAILAWTIRLDFTCTLGDHMKVTHTVRNGYPNALTGAEFWYLFDLTHTPSPSVTTHSGTYYPPLYADLPTSITWCRLSNQFQFDWRDADFPNGHAYLGSGSVVGLAIQILGVSLAVGDIAPGATVVVDPYFSGVTRTWAAASASYSGIAASWSPAGVPATGDNITFDATSTYGCTWNTSVTLGNFNMNTGYSGTVTQGDFSFAVNDWIQNVGTFTGKYTQTITVGGSLYIFGAAGFTADSSYLILASPAGIASFGSTNFRPTMIFVTGNITTTTSIATRQLVVNNASSLTSSAGIDVLANEAYMQCRIWGTLAGAGNINIWRYGSSVSLYGGGVWSIANVGILLRALASASAIVTLAGASVHMTGLLYVGSQHATYTLTLSLGAYALSVAGLTIGIRGVVNPGSSSVVSSAAWDSSAGTFTADTSTVYLTGTGSTVKTANANGAFNNLVVGGTYTTTSSVNVTGALQVNSSKSITVGAGKTLTAANMTSSGQVIGTGALVLATATSITPSMGAITTAPTTIKQLATATGPATVTFGASASFGAGLTVDSEAALDLVLDTGGYDLTSTDLTLTTDANLVADGGSVALSDDFVASGSVDISGAAISVIDDCTLAGASTVVGGSFAVGGDCNISGALTLSPSTLTLSQDLRLSGTASVVITLPFTVTDDLVVASTADLTTSGAITVGGDWLLYDSTWTHGDEVVTLTGTCALNMTTGSFWNVTVSGTATLAEDALVELRATVTGTVIGPGDFIELEPEFTSTPDAQVNILEVYNLTVTQAYWDALSYDGPAFLALYGDRLTGVPQESDAGIYNISLALVWNDMTVYQNWTLVVSFPVSGALDAATIFILSLIFSVIAGFALLVLGLVFKEPIFCGLSGMTWMFSALSTYATLSIGYAILCVGIGMAALVLGALKYVEEGDGQKLG